MEVSGKAAGWGSEMLTVRTTREAGDGVEEQGVKGLGMGVEGVLLGGAKVGVQCTSSHGEGGGLLNTGQRVLGFDLRGLHKETWLPNVKT